MAYDTTTAKISFEIEVTCEVDSDGHAIVQRIDAITGYRDRKWLTTLLATEPQISAELDAAICKAFADQIADAAAEEDTEAADRADEAREQRRDDELMGVR
jgi:hypothetical protein